MFYVSLDLDIRKLLELSLWYLLFAVSTLTFNQSAQLFFPYRAVVSGSTIKILGIDEKSYILNNKPTISLNIRVASEWREGKRHSRLLQKF